MAVTSGASTELTQMYHEVLLDHAKRGVGRGEIATEAPPWSATSHQVNPTCGDEITLRVVVAPGAHEHQVIESIVWEGQGCSISQASASVLAELVTGRSIAQARGLADLFGKLMNSRGQGLPEADMDQLEDAVAFTGVSLYPARIKCALLAWMALRDALLRVEDPGQHEQEQT